MYIAIEGIKGTGKSALLSRIINSASENKIQASRFDFTKAMPRLHPLEQQHNLNEFLRDHDEFLESLFRERARWHQECLGKFKGMIIGDRSIATAYVSRWNKWGDPLYALRKISADYRLIMKPDVIIWIKTSPDMALQLISHRPAKHLRKIDESKDKLVEADDIYEELFTGKLYNKKIARTQIITIPFQQEFTATQMEINSIIKFYSKS